ncbi:glutathione S-transferase family protein [Psychromonas sp. KJ10-10]|uniref:glutathione S-transferase family protein n=1 Tax=Psychromonas sp. KJ10-10 TaxID=3391823 RepID=UPI0039B61A7E
MKKSKTEIKNASRTNDIAWWRLKLNEGITEEEIKQACSRYHQALTKLNNILNSNDWLVGQQISIVDISWYTVLQRLVAIGFPLAEYKEVNHYYKKLSTRPAFLLDSKHRESKLIARVFSIFRFINKLKRNRISDYFK